MQAVDTRRDTSGSLVVVSTRAVPGGIADRTPASLPSNTDSTWVGPGREVQTISQPATAASALSAQMAPRWISGSAASRLMSWTVRSTPESRRQPAMRLPIVPTPMNACLLGSVKAFLLQCGAAHSVKRPAHSFWLMERNTGSWSKRRWYSRDISSTRTIPPASGGG